MSGVPDQDFCDLPYDDDGGNDAADNVEIVG